MIYIGANTGVRLAATLTVAFVMSLSTPNPTPADASVAPAEITWWAFGDSYSSGEGLPNVDHSANPEPSNADYSSNERTCERATGRSSVPNPSLAYSAVARDVIESESLDGVDVVDFRLVACTGAITNHWRRQFNEVGNRRADLITLSMGGNNIAFSQVVRECVGLSIEGAGNILSPITGAVNWTLNPSLGCNVSKEELYARVDALVGKDPANPHQAFQHTQTLPDMYREIANEAVNTGGHVVVLGYPQMVEESGRWTWRLLNGNRCQRIRRADATLFRDVTSYLNDQIHEAVLAADNTFNGVRFHFVDVASIYEGTSGRHGLCTGQPWLNGITLGAAGPNTGALNIRILRSFHPTQRGHNATGERLAELLTSGDFDWQSQLIGSVTPDAPLAQFVGQWSGTIRTPSGSAFQAEVDLHLDGNQVTGTIDHPDVPCEGTTTSIGIDGSTLVLETVYTAESQCIADGVHRLTIGPDESLAYAWYEPNTSRVDRGTLIPANLATSPSVNPTLTLTGIGRSTYSDSYFADVTDVTQTGRFMIEVAFAASGESDLRRPESSCLVHDDGYRASPLTTSLQTDTPGSFIGSQTFAVIVPGDWSFRYSCRSDYPDVAIATLDVSMVGISVYSDDYYAVIYGYETDGSGNRVVKFAAQGYTAHLNELRDPATSCVVNPAGDAAHPTANAYDEFVPGRYYTGTLTFMSATDHTDFLYSCEHDYTTLRLP